MHPTAARLTLHQCRSSSRRTLPAHPPYKPEARPAAPSRLTPYKPEVRPAVAWFVSLGNVRGGRSDDRLGRFEVLGAWLGLWTPPRGAVVPPVPWRRIAIGAALLVAVAGIAAAVVLPRVAEDRRAARERAQAAEARRHEEFLASVDRQQRARTGRARRDPGSGAPPARRRAARTALLASAEAGIASDARRRTDKRIRGVDCAPFPRSLGDADLAADLSRPAAAYGCVAVTARFGSGSQPGGRGLIGIPFRLVARFAAGAFAWCRIVPLGDRDRLSHPLPAACRLPE